MSESLDAASDDTWFLQWNVEIAKLRLIKRIATGHVWIGRHSDAHYIKSLHAAVDDIAMAIETAQLYRQEHKKK